MIPLKGGGGGGADPGLIGGDPLKHQLNEGVRQAQGYRDKMAASSHRLIFSIHGASNTYQRNVMGTETLTEEAAVYNVATRIRRWAHGGHFNFIFIL